MKLINALKKLQLPVVARLEFFICLLLLVLFNGCSWMEFFVVANKSDTAASVAYSINSDYKGFGNFETSPTIYKLINNGDIDWNTAQQVEDSDTSKFGVKILLPPQCALVIGHLMNDHYKKHNQRNADDRVNINHLSVYQKEKIIEISSENFSEYFREHNGSVVLQLK